MENTAIIKLSGDELLNSTNWIVWHERMYIMLQVCKVYEYTQGKIERPNLLIDPQGVRNWLKNDNYTKHLLTLNICIYHRDDESRTTWYLIRMLETASCFIEEQNPQHHNCFYMQPTPITSRQWRQHP